MTLLAPRAVRRRKQRDGGYSQVMGGFAGSQAEYARVPFADVGPLKIEADVSGEKVLFLSDILPTAYMGAEMCDITPGDTLAVWGAGPVGQLAVASALLLGAEKVVAIDRFPARLAIVGKAGAIPLNYEEQDVERCSGRPPRGVGRTSSSTPSGWRPTTMWPRSTPTTRSSR
ncbi:MAG: hypothetical protein KJ792_15775 [Actinobacteria bacterium]|nr:hypothetical protein [Actinomycetota bacterium]MCG2802439.1 hypothetical protein [Cellulomonas sp.]